MEKELKGEYIDKLMNMSEEELEKIFQQLNLVEIEDLNLKVKEGVE